MSAAARIVGRAAGERVLGLGPGRMRAFVAATVTGAATAVATYRLLRSSPLGADQ
jgi:hypothetical protein